METVVTVSDGAVPEVMAAAPDLTASHAEPGRWYFTRIGSQVRLLKDQPGAGRFRFEHSIPAFGRRIDSMVDLDASYPLWLEKPETAALAAPFPAARPDGAMPDEPDTREEPEKHAPAVEGASANPPRPRKAPAAPKEPKAPRPEKAPESKLEGIPADGTTLVGVHHGKEIRAKVEGGKLWIDGQPFTSLSSAAKHACDGSSRNGKVFWKVVA